MKRTAQELKQAIRKLGQGSKEVSVASARSGVDVRPGCAFGAILDQRFKDLEHNLGELKARLTGLIFMVIGAVLVEVVVRLVG